MELSPLELALFVVCNRQRRTLKALYWDRTKQATELVATFADGFVENLATKDDVEHLRGDVEKLRVDMEKLETSLRGDMEKTALRTDLEKTEAKMVGEMSKLAHRLTVRLGGAIGAGVAILVAVDKLF